MTDVSGRVQPKMFGSKHRKHDPDIHPEKHVHPSVLKGHNRKMTNMMNALERR